MRERIFPADEAMVHVVPAPIRVGPFAARLDEASVARLAALPDVAAVYRSMSVRAPAAVIYDGAFFGAQLRMGVEIIALGVEPGYVAADIPAGAFVDAVAGTPIPVLLSARLLDIYNFSFAPSRNLPKLSPEMINGFGFSVEWNRSLVTSAVGGKVIASPMRVAGVSERAILAGLTIPLDTARRLNQMLGGDAETYTEVALKLRSADAAIAVGRVASAMGFDLDEHERRTAEQASLAVLVVTSAMALLSALISILAAFNISRSLAAQVRVREKELAVYRAVGATRRDIRLLVFSEAFILGVVGAAVGIVGSLLVARVVDHFARRALAGIPMVPETFFSHSPLLILGGFALGITASVVGAVAPAMAASAVEPAAALASHGA